MRRQLGAGIELDDERDRIDRAAVHDFLSVHAYWALGRSSDAVAKRVDECARNVGLYDGAAQIGYARIESDNLTYAWLFDVYVLPEYRGRGFGIELARESVDGGPHKDLRWILHTGDARTLYERFGFGPSISRLMERPCRVVGPLDQRPPTPPDEICTCTERSGVKLMSALTPNPLHCLDCNREIEPGMLLPKVAERIAIWNRSYGAIDRLWLDSGPYEAWARAQLIDPESPTNSDGRAIANDLDLWFWMFSAQGEQGWMPLTACPVCSQQLRAHDGWQFCDGCRIVTAA